ncbi:hypothetical protein SAMN04489713_10699 [Actinomadura madurae]|uniref:Pyridoxamine 5'-phosphate oxidase n=1 Tax=Actinomadura madurae TaxID=1993 RepID=A0A1I5HA46_9ACTN|nr:hypothetical protein [Actinomadura madurae]SFO45049.1 hypothetical protein SAMN04489713_10699 [Actinomadura madurae]
MLRSKLWTAVPDAPPAAPGVAAFLATAPFAVISSRDGDERADTPRNLMTCPDVSLAALLPGSGEVLHLSGTAGRHCSRRWRCATSRRTRRSSSTPT